MPPRQRGAFCAVRSWVDCITNMLGLDFAVGTTEMALHVLAYNMKRVMSILGVGGLMEAIRA